MSLSIFCENEEMDYICSRPSSYFNFVFFLNPQMESYVYVLSVIGRLVGGKGFIFFFIVLFSFSP